MNAASFRFALQWLPSVGFPLATLRWDTPHRCRMFPACLLAALGLPVSSAAQE